MAGVELAGLQPGLEHVERDAQLSARDMFFDVLGLEEWWSRPWRRWSTTSRRRRAAARPGSQGRRWR